MFLRRKIFKPELPSPIFLLLYSTVFLNVALAVFNLLPFPPLDGSKALAIVFAGKFRSDL